MRDICMTSSWRPAGAIALIALLLCSTPKPADAQGEATPMIPIDTLQSIGSGPATQELSTTPQEAQVAVDVASFSQPPLAPDGPFMYRGVEDLIDDITPAISNGQPADKSRLPFIVGVKTPIKNCTGILRWRSTVITAASCVDNFENNITLDASYAAKIKVYVGLDNTNPFKLAPNDIKFLDGSIKELSVETLYLQPLYNRRSNNQEFDVVVLRLAYPCVNLQEDLNISTPKPEAVTELISAPHDYQTDFAKIVTDKTTRLMIAGYGRESTASDLVTDTLRYAYVQWTDPDACTAAKDTQFCIKGTRIKNVNDPKKRWQQACLGDVGSPIIYNRENPQDPIKGSREFDVVVGILSGNGKACGDENATNICTNTAFLDEWITWPMQQVDQVCPQMTRKQDEPRCKEIVKNKLSPENEEGGCDELSVAESAMFQLTTTNYKVLWSRKSAVVADPPFFDGLTQRYTFQAGDAIGFTVFETENNNLGNNPILGYSCSGVMRVLDCQPICKDVTITVAARGSSPQECRGKLNDDVRPGGDAQGFWDLGTVAQSASNTERIYVDGVKYEKSVHKNGFFFAVGKYQVQGEIRYTDMKNEIPSKNCTVTVKDITKMLPPSTVGMRKCFYKNGAGRMVSIPLDQVAQLPSGSRCLLRGAAGGENITEGQSVVAANCAPTYINRGRTILCWGNNSNLIDPVKVGVSNATASSVIVDSALCTAAQKLTLTLQTWDRNGPVGGGEKDPAPSVNVTITLYRSKGLVPKGEDCGSAPSSRTARRRSARRQSP